MLRVRDWSGGRGRDQGDGVKLDKINEGKQQWGKEKQKEELEELPQVLCG